MEPARGRFRTAAESQVWRYRGASSEFDGMSRPRRGPSAREGRREIRNWPADSASSAHPTDERPANRAERHALARTCFRPSSPCGSIDRLLRTPETGISVFGKDTVPDAGAEAPDGLQPWPNGLTFIIRLRGPQAAMSTEERSERNTGEQPEIVAIGPERERGT